MLIGARMPTGVHLLRHAQDWRAADSEEEGTCAQEIPLSAAACVRQL